MELGNNIKALRRQKGLRQEQLAEAMGVSTASVSKWETNQCYPELTLLAELADFFEVSMDTLVGHKLNADRLEALITQLEDAVSSRDEEKAAALCEKILRNYPNNARAVEACTDAYYQLYVYTDKPVYMEYCIAETKRLMSLKEGEPARERLARIHYLGNQYAHLEQWDTAKEYYEQSNVSGSSNESIAECLLKQGETRKAIAMLSEALLNRVFQTFGVINTLADGWIAMDEHQKALSALEWMYHVMESLHYNPTLLVLLQVRFAGLYQEQGKPEAARAAMEKAAELVKENNSQEFAAAADFLQIEKVRKMLISAPEDNREFLRCLAEKMDRSFIDIINEVLQ